MDDGDDRRAAMPLRAATQSARGQRLAAALRANLAKRKQQSRARAGGGERPAPSERVAQTGQVGMPSHDSAEIVVED